MSLVAHVFLREHRDEILRAWESLVLANPDAVKLVGPILRDHLPGFLEDLADWFQRGDQPGTSKMRADTLRHALDRLEHSYQLAQVIREFRLLRTTILRLLLTTDAGEWADTAETARRAGELARLNAGLDVAITDVVEQFVAGRDCRDATERNRADEVLRESERRLRLYVQRRGAEEALRRSETRFRALIEKASDIILVLDADLVVRYAATTALGFSSEEVVGRSSLDLVHPEDRQAVEEVYRDLVARAGGTAHFTVRRIHKDGTSHVMDAIGRNALDDPALQGIVLNMRDVTEQRRLEGQLLQAQKMEGIGRLAGGIAHDFNNILSVILSSATFAMESLREGDPLWEDLLEIEKAGQRAASLTRQLLAFSRKQVLQPEPLDLNRILGEMERMLRRIIGEDIDLAQVLAPDLGVVKADPGQIEQVVMNLVVNARDAMPEGGKLTIETANVELDAEYAALQAGTVPGPHVMIAVSDSGVGMDEMTLARVFEPFFTTKESGRGSGLGLSTVYGIVKQSGGSIHVHSEPGQGTTIKVFLPRELSLKPVIKVPPLPARSGGSETVLVVEDDEAVRRVAKRILDAAGYTVLTAANGAEALRTCERHTAEIHIVLTDVVMPEMSGRAFIDRFATVRSGIKVLYMSGYTGDAVLHHGILDPGTRFIGKPLTQDELLRKVREVLDG